MSPILDELVGHLEMARAGDRPKPFVTLAYAQSLDGSIAGTPAQKLSLSCDSSLQLTHELRAVHDAILIGIGTALSDNPRLNVRLVSGSDPQPIVVDSRLRLPRESHLLRDGRACWLATTHGGDAQRRRELESSGARVLCFPALPNGWVDLEAMLETLAANDVSHLLVEGGSRILTSFLKAGLADYAVLTLSPQFIGGVPAIRQQELPRFARLHRWQSERFGDDLVVAGELAWSSE